MKTKTFDCVEMKRRGAELVRQKLQGMTDQEQLAYWQRRAEEMRTRQRELRKQAAQK